MSPAGLRRWTERTSSAAGSASARLRLAARGLIRRIRDLGDGFLSDRALILRSGLFDPGFYRSFNGLERLEPERCLAHYLRSTATGHLRPHPLFDPGLVVAQMGEPRRRSPLAAYLRRGWRRSVRPNPLFDPSWYLATNPDVRLAGLEPLTHYADRGWREGRGTSERFDPAAEIPLGGAAPASDPLAARLMSGADDLAPLWQGPVAAAVDVPPRPPLRARASPVVDVVVPVHSGLAETLTTLHRVLSAASRTPCEIVAVDDASPDPRISAALRDLAGAGAITLLVNDENLGFVRSTNRGLALHPDRDAVLLNADTEVFDGWIDRLAAAACSAGDVATATPWSNAATILSYPVRLRDNHVPLELGDAELDRMAAALAVPPVEIPTGVGFCMYVRRACLTAVGPLDEGTFGRGYGEENDLCRRAVRAGWRNLAALDVFVRHRGATSFGPEKAARVQAAVQAVERLHPGYLAAVHAFNAADPLALPRRRLDEARLRSAQPNSTLVVGGRGPAAGGAGGLVRLVPEAGRRAGLFRLEAERVPVTPNLPPFDLRRSDAELADILRRLDISGISVAPDAPERLARRLRPVAALAGLDGAGSAPRSGP